MTLVVYSISNSVAPQSAVVKVLKSANFAEGVLKSVDKRHSLEYL